MNLNFNIHSQRGRWEQGRSPVGCSPRLHHLFLSNFNLFLFGFDGVVRGLHPTNVYFIPILFYGALENSTLRFFSIKNIIF